MARSYGRIKYNMTNDGQCQTTTNGNYHIKNYMVFTTNYEKQAYVTFDSKPI